MTAESRTILFLMRNLFYLRNFEAPIRALAERGHRVVIFAGHARALPAEITEQADHMSADFGERVSFGPAGERADFRRILTAEIHSGRDILRYYTPALRSADRLRRRAIAKATPLARFACRRDRFWDSARNRAADRRLARWDAAIPVDRSIRDRIAALAPDLFIVTPLIDLRSAQIDWVRAARSLGIPTVLAVASWDNLTSKSRIQVQPDRVLVWNDLQRREAVDLHGVPPESVTVTGAQLYDTWFERKPSTSRAAFADSLGFDPERPIILYAGSSIAISADEPAFIRRWLEVLRGSSDAVLRTANVLIRPHPMNQAGYAKLDIEDLGPAIVHPLTGGFPVTGRDRALYFDSLFHSAALVGLNTSALVEASILGKPCFTIRDASHTGGQQGTIHYGYIAARILHESDTLAEHATALAAALREPREAGATDEFVREFIRPRGLAVAGTPLFVAAIEEAMAAGPTVTPARPATLVVRLLLDLAALAMLGGYGTVRLLRRLSGRSNPDQTTSAR